jgi:hypothetical protein
VNTSFFFPGVNAEECSCYVYSSCIVVWFFLSVLYSHPKRVRDAVSEHDCQHLFLFLLYFLYGRCLVIIHHGFNLYFPN